MGSLPGYDQWKTTEEPDPEPQPEASRPVPSSEDFNTELYELVYEMSSAQLFALPGFYELVSEALNNEVIDRWREATGT